MQSIGVFLDMFTAGADSQPQLPDRTAHTKVRNQIVWERSGKSIKDFGIVRLGGGFSPLPPVDRSKIRGDEPTMMSSRAGCDRP